MTPAARVQAAIELLDQTIAAAKSEGPPADRLIAQYFKQRRYAGSKDRRAVRELVYSAIRRCGEIPHSGRAALLALAADDTGLAGLFDGSRHGPAAIAPSDQAALPGVAPKWLIEELSRSGVNEASQAALLDRAALDCRVNTLKADRRLIETPIRGQPLRSQQGLRFDTGTSVEQWDAYRHGQIEVQDLGSQLVCEAIAALPGETVVDLCAGAGGKTLALAAAMENSGRLIACDTDRGRLSRFTPRSIRAGVTNAEARLLNPEHELDALEDVKGLVDAVLIDAPCSGVGTWRRKPEAKWRLTPDRLARFANLQDYLLDTAAKILRPGGRLVFVTCSLLDREGSDRFSRFLRHNPGFSPSSIDLPLGRRHGSGYRLEPFQDGTDGFFVAIARSS